METDNRALDVHQREQAFILRYDALFRWACRLTNDPVEAEDLLQDCYVAFVSTSTNTVIDNLDGYLRRMLSNLLRSKRMREARHAIVELDEQCDLEVGVSVLAQIEERERQQEIKRQLKLIYDFANCPNTALGRTKGGKIFILRYYQQKIGSEVARLTGSTLGAVHQWVRIARHEIRKRHGFKVPH